MTQDNVLVRMDQHIKAEKKIGSLFIPETADKASTQAARTATVIAAGPGYFNDKFVNHEVGTHPVGSRTFIPLDPSIQPGARVILSAAALAGDRVNDPEGEMRIIKAHCIEALVIEE